MITSTIKRRAPVIFPAFTAERIYMEPIYNGLLPPQYARWQETVDMMIAGMPAPAKMYIMVDQKACHRGQAHRRPGIHVDGYWDAGTGWDSDPPGWAALPAAHKPHPPGHGPSPGHRVPGNKWETATFDEPEALLLASNISACRAFVGMAPIGVAHMGDCSQLNISGMETVPMDAGFCYAGTVGTLHESLPVPYDCQRTVVRLNIPGVSV